MADLSDTPVTIVGASRGLGRVVAETFHRLGAQVLAVASGADGVEFVRRLGADAAVDGRHGDVAAVARAFAGDGIDAALVLVNGRGLSEALALIKRDGRVAYPHGVEPEPEVPAGVTRLAYDGTPGRDALERLNALIGSGRFHVELDRMYRLEDAGRAHRELGQHHLGKLALRLHAA